MKKPLINLVTLLFCCAASYSQTIDMPIDSIKTFLCKQWEAEYVMMGGIKIVRRPGATDINFAFTKDNKLTMWSASDNKKNSGTWTYDQNAKVIKVTVNGRSVNSVISLSDAQLVMLTKDDRDGFEVKTFYKLKGE